MRTAVLPLAAVLACAPSKSGLRCGEGTVEESGVCVPVAADSDADSDADIDADTDTDTDADADADTDTDADADPARLIAYFTEWGVYDRDYQVADIPADQLTHLLYAFADISAGGECVVYDAWAALEREGGNFALLRGLKAAHPHLRVLLSVGGWTLSGRFPEVAATADARARFATSCVSFMRTHGFDGLDIDWEYPVAGGLSPGRPEDKQNYTLLLRALRDELDATGGGLLTIAGPIGVDKIANLEPAGIAAEVDWINVMAYDLHGAWDPITHFGAPLAAGADFPGGTADPLTIAAGLQAWRDAGVPASQLVLGIPFYGRGFSGVAPTNDGLFQPWSGQPWGSYETGVFDAWDIERNEVPRAGCTRHWHAAAAAPWLSCTDGTFFTWDDAEALDAKLALIHTEGLGGAMVWSLDGDLRPEHTFIAQLAAGLGTAAP